MPTQQIHGGGNVEAAFSRLLVTKISQIPWIATCGIRLNTRTRRGYFCLPHWTVAGLGEAWNVAKNRRNVDNLSPVDGIPQWTVLCPVFVGMAKSESPIFYWYSQYHGHKSVLDRRGQSKTCNTTQQH